NNGDEPEIGAVKAEEQWRPRGVENELNGVDSERQRCTDEPGLSPNQPTGHRNHYIENCPHRREQPVWRSPRWLLQVLVPFTRPEESTCHGRKKAGCKEGQQRKPGRRIHDHLPQTNSDPRG